MSALALALPIAPEPESVRDVGAASADPGGEPTLDSLLSGVWEGLAAHRSVACPVCGGEMRPEYGVHARPIGGRCASCETRFS
ncbi:MAG TPA: hypothetical protein VFN87_06960 [Solirubrobacteraceae bacterium]|nr:hypothetical protein [Solirubrobacteraceae bacterium]